MKRKKSWFQVLTKKEREHIRWSLNGLQPTLKRFLDTREHQKRQKIENPDILEPCHECWSIEHKLAQKGFIVK